MFALSVRQLLPKCRTIGLIRSKSDVSSGYKFLRDRELKKVAKLQSIKDLVIQRNGETNGDIQWNQLVSELVEQKLVYKQNFEMDLMSAFLLNNGNDSHQLDPKLFKSMVSFIKVLPNIVNNSIASSRYCHFISHFNEFIDKTDIDLIRRTADQMMDKYIQNKITHEVMFDSIIGLSKSSKDNCLHSIDLSNRLQGIDCKVFTNIIESCIQYKLFDQTFALITDKRYSNLKLNEEIVTKIIESITEWNLNLQKTFNLFEIFSKKLIVFNSELKPKLLELLERYSYKSVDTFIGKNGLCLKCNNELKGVSAEEQKHLFKSFESTIFDKQNNLRIASFPEYERELQFFQRFMKRITKDRPLDLVIDGLNIAFNTNADIVEDEKNLRKYVLKYTRKQIDKNAVEMILRNNIIDKYKNILIIGRKHMKKWKNLNEMLANEESISMFYAIDETQDDSYTVYSALQNPNTYIISSDFYRDYSEKMGTNSTLFERWLKTHQILIEERKHFVYPDQFDYRIHISDQNRIHIPFKSSDELGIQWICCEKQKLLK